MVAGLRKNNLNDNDGIAIGYRSSHDGDHTHASRWRKARARERVLEPNYFVSLPQLYARYVTFLKMHKELLVSPIRGKMAISDTTNITLVTFFKNIFWLCF